MTLLNFNFIAKTVEYAGQEAEKISFTAKIVDVVFLIQLKTLINVFKMLSNQNAQYAKWINSTQLNSPYIFNADTPCISSASKIYQSISTNALFASRAFVTCGCMIDNSIMK